MPIPSSAGVSRRMARQRRRDTGAELALRRELHRRGLRYRVDVPVPGLPRRRADLLFSKAKVAVFVDGCFWHGCKEHKTMPRANDVWWRQKLDRNVERDQETDRHLIASGWRVVRVWEHDPIDEAVTRVLGVLGEPQLS